MIEQGYATNVIQNAKEIKLEHDSEYADFMETCTESIADMLVNSNEKDFRTFSIPSDEMSSITYNKKMRRLLIMAVGSDEFILDMLRKDKQLGIQKLNALIKHYTTNEINLVDFLTCSGEYASCKGKIERGIDEENLSDKMNNSLQRMEQICTKIFMNRIKEAKSKSMSREEEQDINEQIQYYEELLETDLSKELFSKAFKQIKIKEKEEDKYEIL